MTSQQRITHRQMQKEDTKRIILDAAYSLFAEKGYAKTTMRALAAQAGVGLGTIFKHFPDKSSLLAAAFQEDLGRIIHDAFASLPVVGIKKQLLHITKNIYGFYAENPKFSRNLIKEALFLEGEHGEILDAQLMAFLDEIAGLLEKAVQRGELKKGTDPHSGALAFGSFYFTGLLLGLKQPKFDIDAQLKIVETLLENYF